MALKKTIILNNGIPLNYHRISEINNIVNKNTVLTIYSYVNKKQREREKNNDYKYPDEIFKITDYAVLPYNDKLTIQEAYEYLKTTEKYEGAEDVFEEKEEEMINNETSTKEMV